MPTPSDAPEFDEGLAHLANRRWDAAIVTLRLAAQREPGRLAVVRALASAYLGAGDITAARQTLADYTMSNRMSAEGWRLAAQLEWKLNCRGQAVLLIKRGLDHLPNSPVLHRQMALFLGAAGNLDESSQHANRAGGDRVELYVNAARGSADDAQAILDGDAQSPAADLDWLDRLAQDTKLLESILGAPQVESDHAMLRELEARLAALLACQPYHADRHLLLARLQMRINALPAAMLSVQRSLRANPEYIDAHRLRATLCEQVGDFDGALAILHDLVARGCDWPDIHFQIATLEHMKGNAGEARSHLYSAIRINPAFTAAREMLESVAA